MEFLYDLPVLGFLFQFLGYVIDAMATSDLPARTLRLATPIALGALCGVMCERSGIVNIGIEGMMLTCAFVGFMAAVLVDEAMPDATASPFFGATPAMLIGVLAAIIAGMLVAALHAWLSISVRADQIISGTVINITALGLTGYLNRLIRPSGSAGTFDQFEPPAALVELPIIGWILRMFLEVGPIAMSVIVFVIVLQVLLFRSRWGLRTRAVGEHPRAADTVGIDVIRLRYRNVIIGGVFAGLAGAWLTLEANASFQNGMTANRGFIALAAVIFGRWTPIGALGGALLFMFSESLGISIRSDPPPGDLGVWLSGIQAQYPSIYNNFFSALPYVLTIIVLAGVVGRSIAPAAVGRPYVKEGAT
jgi:simple sugar transport system permease protein